MEKLILYTFNKEKKLEREHIEKYISVDESIYISNINYNKNENINKLILQSYETKPDIIIINMNIDNKKNQILNIKKIPKYPIYLNDIFYITPICIEQINGFSNDYDNKLLLTNDFIERILQNLGGLITDKEFEKKYIKLDFINIKSGLRELRFGTNDFRSQWFVNNIPNWMSKHFEINKCGWFSIYNKIAIDYIFDNYDIKNIAELGSYYGLSSKYIASKNTSSNLYCFDEFRNILLTDFVIKTIQPIDTKYFLRYIKFESFHKNLSNYSNVYSIKYNCFNAVSFFKKFNMKIDLFYIDFCKKDKFLKTTVDNILKNYPNSIILGDDAEYLKDSLNYFKSKYNFILLDTCYICSLNTKLINTDKLIDKINEEKLRITTDNINIIKNLDSDHKIKFISGLIEKNKKYEEVLDNIKVLNLDPNTKSNYLIQNSNIYHFIALNYTTNITYYKGLYEYLIKYYPDKQVENNMNLTPNDYFTYGNFSFF
jgi:hypothetical protein